LELKAIYAMQRTPSASWSISAFQFSWKSFFVVFSLTVLVLAFKYREPYFQRPIYEQDDFAANALSIRNAADFKETLGNYSRWHFRHPGPIMFYAYALGDGIFHRVLKICPAEHNAHLVAGMLLQAAFWAAIFGMLGSYAFSLRSLCLVWIAGWVHFHFTRYAFVSLWPPHVLLMPFACYAVACTSVAAGRVAHLWISIPSGLVLVHGHVAQPLSVGLLAIAAMGGAAYWWRRDGGLRWPLDRGRVLWVGTILLTVAALLLPILVDLARWPHSNANAILDYLALNRHDGKSFSQSLDYLLQFARYWSFHDEPGKELFSIIFTHAYYFMAWCLLSILSVKFAVRNAQFADRGMGRLIGCFAIIFGVSLFAAILWGMRMAGPMFAFNGFYFYAIYFLAICTVCLGWSELRLKPLSILNPAVVAVAVLVPFAFKPVPLLSDTSVGAEVKATIDSLVQSGRIDPSKPYIFGYFPHLPSAVTLVNTLERAGVKVFVPESGEWLMGRRFALSDSTRFETPPSLLQLSPQAPGRTGEVPLYDGARLTVETNHRDPATFPLTIDFNGTPGVGVSGFVSNGVEPPWSIDRMGDIILLTLPTVHDVRVSFKWLPLSGPSNGNPRRIDLKIAGMPDRRFSIAELREDSVIIPASAWNEKVRRHGFIQLRLDFLDPISPKQCGLGEDPRPLSVSFRGLTFETVK